MTWIKQTSTIATQKSKEEGPAMSRHNSITKTNVQQQKQNKKSAKEAPPWNMNISCTSTTAESMAKISYQKNAF